MSVLKTKNNGGFKMHGGERTKNDIKRLHNLFATGTPSCDDLFRLISCFIICLQDAQTYFRNNEIADINAEICLDYQTDSGYYQLIQDANAIISELDAVLTSNPKDVEKEYQHIIFVISEYSSYSDRFSSLLPMNTN